MMMAARRSEARSPNDVDVGCQFSSGLQAFFKPKTSTGLEEHTTLFVVSLKLCVRRMTHDPMGGLG